MNEGRIARMIRELRCDPITQWFETLFGIDEAASAPALDAEPSMESAPPIPEEGSEIESWLM